MAMAELGTETALSLAQKAGAHLASKGIEQPRLEAELLLSAVLGISRLNLYLQFDRPVDEVQLERFRQYIRRRLKREPLQYILGRTTFRKLELAVDSRVLIPRPETEVLVDYVLRWLKTQEPAQTVLDLGTGSGAIALSVVKESSAAVVATDASEDALAVAQHNARRLGLEDRIDFRAGDLWQPLSAGDQYDAIVSNPPYVADSDRTTLPPEVRDWEPARALYAGAGGLDLIEAIVTGAAPRMRIGGLLALEIGADQASAVRAVLEHDSRYTNVRIHKDLAGRERVVLAETRKG
jgi:release factor glutamine methyltransferase